MPVGSGACNSCPLKIVRDSLRKEDTKSCTMILIENAIELINRQKAEIEQWKEESNKYQKWWCEAEKDIQTAKAEAIKEFAERFKKKAGSIVASCQGYEIYETKQYQISAVDFDNLVAEMVGEGNG